MDAVERRLLNDFQRDFPLVERPFAVLAATLGVTEDSVLTLLARGIEDGRVSRVGAVFRPGTIGASTLAAMAVPRARLPAVAQLVSAQPEVNHNYEREHELNLWFVATAGDGEKLARVLGAIERSSGLSVFALPLLADYYIDLAFDLDHGQKHCAGVAVASGPCEHSLDPGERALVAALQGGLPLVPQPFAALAKHACWLGCDGEQRVITRIGEWQDRGVVKRFGIVVRHRALGYVANAMCVWDVPLPDADRIGRALAAEAGVTLCYRRARAGTVWPYNLYCMLHGRDRAEVETRIAMLTARHGLARYPHAVLFSRRAFKQRGARYVELAEASDG